MKKTRTQVDLKEWAEDWLNREPSMHDGIDMDGWLDEPLSEGITEIMLDDRELATQSALTFLQRMTGKTKTLEVVNVEHSLFIREANTESYVKYVDDCITSGEVPLRLSEWEKDVAIGAIKPKEVDHE